MSEKSKQISELSLPELNKKIRDTRQELLELRLKKKTGQLEKTHILKQLRRDIARLETLATKKRAATAA